MDYKKLICEKLNIEGVDKSELYGYIEVPPNTEMGDFALPCFKLARALRKPPVKIAEDLANSFVLDDNISGCVAVNGYLNFKINRNGFAKTLLSDIISQGEKYGSDKIGEGKTVCIDYSSINIAKPFHIGHLKTTVIGGALYNIYKYLGYNVTGVNHLGDYGTQFGKLIVSYKKWGNKKRIL
jgi:arginyl-tRNA synthetase